MDATTERLQELEIRYTHQERLLDELSAVLAAACARIDRLEEDHRSLRGALRRLASDDYTLSPDE